MKGVELSQLGETSGRRILHAPEFIPEHSQEGFSQGLQQGPPPLPLLSGATLSSSPTPTPATFRSRPRGGQASKHLRVLSWNAGHLGVQQWAEIRTWLREDSSSVCDVLVLQETHWNETAEFDVEGWHCISSAKKGAARAPKKKQLLGNARRRKLHRSKTPSWTRAERTE